MNWEELKEKLVNSKYHYFHTDNGVLLCGDCLEVMKEIPDRSIDLVIADPPYSTPVITAYGRRKERNYGDLSIQRNFFLQIKHELENILNKQSAVFMFCDARSYPVLYEVFYIWET